MDKVLSVYWFAILFIVAGGLIYISVSFYGQQHDVREIEANFLIDKVADCVFPDGYLDSEFLNPDFDSKNFLKFCSLNFNTEDFSDWKQKQQYYLSVEISVFPDGDSKFKFKNERTGLADFCNLQESSASTKTPICVERNFYAIDKNNPEEKYLIQIKSVVDKLDKNV